MSSRLQFASQPQMLKSELGDAIGRMYGNSKADELAQAKFNLLEKQQNLQTFV